MANAERFSIVGPLTRMDGCASEAFAAFLLRLCDRVEALEGKGSMPTPMADIVKAMAPPAASDPMIDILTRDARRRDKLIAATQAVDAVTVAFKGWRVDEEETQSRLRALHAKTGALLQHIPAHVTDGPLPGDPLKSTSTHCGCGRAWTWTEKGGLCPICLQARAEKAEERAQELEGGNCPSCGPLADARASAAQSDSMMAQVRDLVGAADWAGTVEKVTALLNWKESALKELNECQLQEVGKALGVPLGRPIPPAILPGIQALQQRITRLTTPESMTVQLKGRITKADAWYVPVAVHNREIDRLEGDNRILRARLAEVEPELIRLGMALKLPTKSQDERIGQLQRDLESEVKCRKHWMDATTSLNRAVERFGKIERGIQPFLQHRDGCALGRAKWKGPNPDCTCGLNAAMEPVSPGTPPFLVALPVGITESDVAFIQAMARGVLTARAKYPGNTGRFVALAAESGEAFHAMQRLETGRGTVEDLGGELRQMAQMALRMAVEGDASFPPEVQARFPVIVQPDPTFKPHHPGAQGGKA